jgi:curved DNA-binding protein CbpA
MADDPYKVLGVPEGAGDVSIKRAYRRKMFILHPDTGSGDTEAIQRIREAYELLLDKEKRAKYDKVRKIFEDDKKEKEERDNRPSPSMPFSSYGSGGGFYASGSAYVGGMYSSGSSMGWGGNTIFTAYIVRTTLDFVVSIGDTVYYSQSGGFSSVAMPAGTPYRVIAIYKMYTHGGIFGIGAIQSYDVELEQIP